MIDLKHDTPEIDEDTWHAWIKKNETQDRLRFARRVRVLAVVFIIAAFAALVWRFA